MFTLDFSFAKIYVIMLWEEVREGDGGHNWSDVSSEEDLKAAPS